MISPVKVWRNEKKIQKLLGITGHIISWTRVFIPPSGFSDNAPYVIAVVKLENGKMYTAQLVDFDENNLTISQKIITILRKTHEPGEEGIIPYGIKFKPIDE